MEGPGIVYKALAKMIGTTTAGHWVPRAHAKASDRVHYFDVFTMEQYRLGSWDTLPTATALTIRQTTSELSQEALIRTEINL